MIQKKIPSLIKYLILTVISITWVYILVQFENFRLFIGLLPFVFVFNIAKSKKIRNYAITLFVIAWSFLFHYETLRYFYLEPLFKKPLPKTKYLFPPAGWIMFYEVGDSFGYREVFGIKGTQAYLLDPHEVFRTRTIGFDNIYRGILSSAASKYNGIRFCRYLNYRFPFYDNFAVKIVYYPSLTKQPESRIEKIEYTCKDS